MIEKIVVFLLFMLPMAFIFVKELIDEKGIYKAKAILGWLGLYTFGIIFNINTQTVELSLIDCVIIIIEMLWGYLYSMLIITDLSVCFWKKSGVIIVWCYVSFVFAVTALEIHRIELVCVFKVWLLLTLLMGLVALKNVVVFGQIIGAIILYILVISVNAVLSNEFLIALSEQQFWKGVYVTIQRSYCLNPISEDLSDANVRMYIVDFFACRIWDVVLLGFISSKFMKITENDKLDIKR